MTSTGIVIIDCESRIIDKQLIKTKPEKYPEIEPRFLYIVNTIGNIIQKYIENIKGLCIEGISYNSKGQSSYELAALNYLIRIWLFQNSVSFITISPTQLKKFVTGNGQCKKNLMLLQTFKKFGEEMDDDNICDAYCLARYVLDEKNKNIGKLDNAN